MLFACTCIVVYVSVIINLFELKFCVTLYFYKIKLDIYGNLNNIGLSILHITYIVCLLYVLYQIFGISLIEKNLDNFSI